MAADPHVEMTVPAAPTPAGGDPPLRLVVLEDNADYAYLVREMLHEGFGRDAVEVESFETLAESRGLDSADCALVDLSLPDGSGLEVVERVQAAAPNVPLVILTGAEDEALALRAVELGAQDYLVKRRVDPEVLHRSIRYAIERKRAEGQRAALLRARAAQAEAEVLSSTLARLQDVADAAIAVHGAPLDTDALLHSSLAVIAADAGALLLHDQRTSALTAAAVRGIGGLRPHASLPPSGTVAAAAMADGPIVVDDIGADEGGPFGHAAGIRSLVAVPVEADGRRLGSLVAVARVANRFSQEQARLLALAADRCARALANAAAYQRDRKASAALQAGLLPQAVPDLRHGEIAVRFLPARDGPPVGGDWYDAILLGDGRLGLAIGDVTGHGAEAAVLMGQLRTALRAYALEGTPPAVVIERLNTLALSLGDPAIATLVYIVLDASLESGQYVIAGHPPPIVISADRAWPLAGAASLPAGVSADTAYEQHELRLAPGDALCLYSDGLVEERGTDFAVRERALVAALGTAAGAEVLCERALAALRPTGPGDDDVALLVLRTSASAQALKAAFPAIPESLSEARAALGAWLGGFGVGSTDLAEITLACNEACMNVVEHAYDGKPGEFAIEGYFDNDTVVVIVRDLGRWTEVQARGRGRGLKLMEAMMDSVQLSFSADGTVVVMRRSLGREIR